MAKFIELDPSEITGNVFDRIGKEWMLITAGKPEKYNTMTASWGGLGVLWNANVSFAFVRPSRYTFEFLEREKYYTLSFLGLASAARCKLRFQVGPGDRQGGRGRLNPRVRRARPLL